MQMSTEEFESRLDELEIEQIGDDGEPLVNEPDPCDVYHSYIDSMSEAEFEALRKKHDSYKRINDFMNSKGYKGYEISC
jgi:hypothetical protein